MLQSTLHAIHFNHVFNFGEGQEASAEVGIAGDCVLVSMRTVKDRQFDLPSFRCAWSEGKALGCS
jgi:hypothetical protein